MSTVYVVDASFKRTQIKVTPGTYLRDVLDEACKQRKLNSSSYTLKTQNNRVVDLSQPFRLSGLTAGAKLQLTQASRSPSVVNVALQLPESDGGKRVTDRFPSNTSLWVVLRKFEDAVAGGQQQKLNLTQRGVPSNASSGSGRLEYEQPCLNLQARNLDTFTDLQKTLAQLGYNDGSILMRVSFKSTGQPLEEAMKEIEQYFNAVDTIPAEIGSTTAHGAEGVYTAPSNIANGSVPIAGAENAAVPLKNAAEPDVADPLSDSASSSARSGEPMMTAVLASSSETSPTSSSVAARESGLSQDSATPLSNMVNGITVYRPPSSSTPAAALQEDDPTVFEPQIEHAKAHQAALQRASRNKRLLSDKELEEQEAVKQERLSTISDVKVRVRYPDGSQIETSVSASTTTAADLYGKVQGTLRKAPEPFELRYVDKGGHLTLPQNSSKKLVRDFGFQEKVLVTLVWSQDASADARTPPSLKDEYRNVAQELKVELATQRATGEMNHVAAMKAPEKPQPGRGANNGNIEDKLKKFMGFGKKK